MDIPIFDTLTHPTIDGDWIMPKYPQCAGIDKMLDEMRANNIKKAFAVGMKGIGSYDQEKFIKLVRGKAPDELLPVAFFDFDDITTTQGIVNKLITIKNIGYCGIKLHPRIGNFTLDNQFLPIVIDKANEMKLAVLFCTYFYSNKQPMTVNNIDRFNDMLLKVNEKSRVILLHGGVVRLLEMMEIVRAFPNLLMDLSLTMCKYAGSSLDEDIKFLFQSFDRRICVGSDHPEINFATLRKRFNHFASFTTVEKAENIAHKNIESWINHYNT